MQIKHILASKGINTITIAPERSLRDAVGLLAKHNIGVLVVVNPAGEPVGILSERDLIRAVDRFEDVFKRRVDEIMTKNVIVGSPNDDLRSVVQTMSQKHFRHLPIMDQGKLAGIVSIVDIVKAQAEEYQGTIETLQTYITG